MRFDVGLADSVQHFCIHEPYCAARSVGTLAGQSSREAVAATSADYLWYQLKIPRRELILCLLRQSVGNFLVA